MALDEELTPRPSVGRAFSAERRVRLGDVGPRGRLRLDAAARFLQDISNDDVIEADLEGAMAWVVRRTRIDVHAFPVFRENLSLTTWGSAIGARWASRRIEVRGDRGGHLEAEALWVHLDIESGMPRKLPDSFVDLFGEAAEGRTIRARLHHGPVAAHAERAFDWPLRFADVDLMGHVNNAISWAIVEEELAQRSDLRTQIRAEVEHPGPIDPGQQVAVHVARHDDGVELWALADGQVATTAQVRRMG